MLELIIIAAVIAADQVTKLLTVKFLPNVGDTFPLIEDFFHFTYVENRGAAFGMFQNSTLILTIASAVLCIVLAAILITKRRHKFAMPKIVSVCAALVLAGGFGNLIDRVWLGYVRDMLDFRAINFAVFNVADSAVTVGAILFAVYMLFSKNGRSYIQNILTDKTEDKK